MGTILKKGVKYLKASISPTFIIILFVSFGLWYVSKLRYTYRTEVPIFINIEENNIKVNCLAEGTGYRLVAHKFLTGNKMVLSVKNLKLSPSPTNPGSYIIDKLSLQNTISVQTRDIRILSIDNVPEITIADE